MSESLETTELKKFHLSLMQDLKSTQLSDEEGGTLEQIFTQLAVDVLADAGETENVRVAYDEKQLGTKNQHKINAYAEPDNYETIDLFITIFKGADEPVRIPKDEIDTAAKRISNFHRKAKYKNYVNEIEESSPIWDFARTLSSLKALDENLVRINAIILTDGLYPGEIPKNDNISGCPVYFRVVDLNYLYNITEKAHVPIEIDFEEDGYEIPCIVSPSENDQYQSYLAILPGKALATIYERYGSRLLEQNVRSFLQFTGKINKGIRKTILEEPHMFLAFNNGIAATAESLELGESKNGKGVILSKVKDFQIVNGGQTTASIYHTFKKEKADVSKIFVQVKLSVVKNRNKFSEIVSRIAEYANTQNKVSVSDLSSNHPYHIELEKLSRSIFVPHIPGQNVQTKWFYERARGQYKNARLKNGFTKTKQKEFDQKNPKSQLFTKEDLAKFVNTFSEVYNKSKKLVIGPHIVVRGNQKNYTEFIKYNLIEKPDNVYFEDVVAKAILFRSAEKVYGVKPNSIGDMRYVTVPYSIALLSYRTDNKLDLYKIWKNQEISENLKKLLYDLMVEVERYIKATAPGNLYGEWAKKEECWNQLKRHDFNINFKNTLRNDLEDPNNLSARRRLDDDDIQHIQAQEELSTIRGIPQEAWQAIADWGKNTELMSPQQATLAQNIYSILKRKTTIDEKTRQDAILILNHTVKYAPEILEEIEEVRKNQIIELIKKIVRWNAENQVFDSQLKQYMSDLAEEKRELTEEDKRKVIACLTKLEERGYKVA
ncbi:MAG: AIPR family protein [Acidobacteriota bacterium]|nr:AIPR family protein [Acidobacteriota bacterium]